MILCQPWVLHYFPSMTMEQFDQGNWTLPLYVGMYDFATAD